MTDDTAKQELLERAVTALEEMAKAQERIAVALESQKQGKGKQVIEMAAGVATITAAASVIALIIKWITGG
jgi:uncharacterized RmlC-like cupin family protein